MENENAFPYFGKAKDESGRTIEWFDFGMTLRDYFAAKAIPLVFSKVPEEDDYFFERAEDCYKIADAMLKEREKE